jgi:hypothetical protein
MESKSDSSAVRTTDILVNSIVAPRKDNTTDIINLEH